MWVIIPGRFSQAWIRRQLGEKGGLRGKLEGGKIIKGCRPWVLVPNWKQGGKGGSRWGVYSLRNLLCGLDGGVRMIDYKVYCVADTCQYKNGDHCGQYPTIYPGFSRQKTVICKIILRSCVGNRGTGSDCKYILVGKRNWSVGSKICSPLSWIGGIEDFGLNGVSHSTR